MLFQEKMALQSELSEYRTQNAQLQAEVSQSVSLQVQLEAQLKTVRKCVRAVSPRVRNAFTNHLELLLCRRLQQIEPSFEELKMKSLSDSNLIKVTFVAAWIDEHCRVQVVVVVAGVAGEAGAGR